MAASLDRWQLRRAGPPARGGAAFVLPVAFPDGTPAVLKLQPVDEETAGEPAALRAWGGRDAVRLLRHDPDTGAMVLERLDAGKSLATMPDDLAATQIISELLSGLNAVRPPAGLRRLDDVAAQLLARVPPTLARLADQQDRRLVRYYAGAVRELLPAGSDQLLHWDLHYDNVLAVPLDAGPSGATPPVPPAAVPPAAVPPAAHPSGRRGHWVAIDPKPLAGESGFELLAALHNRWDDVVATGDAARAVRRRFDLMTEVLGLDRQRAATWTLGRVLQNLIWEVAATGSGSHAGPDRVIADALPAARPI